MALARIHIFHQFELGIYHLLLFNTIMDMADSAPNEAKQETEINTIEIPRPRQKLLAMEFYEKVLGAPKYVVSIAVFFPFLSCFDRALL